MDVSVSLRLLFTKPGRQPSSSIQGRHGEYSKPIKSSNKGGPAARDDIVAVSENAGETVTEYIQVLFILQVLPDLIPKRLGGVGFT